MVTEIEIKVGVDKGLDVGIKIVTVVEILIKIGLVKGIGIGIVIYLLLIL